MAVQRIHSSTDLKGKSLPLSSVEEMSGFSAQLCQESQNAIIDSDVL